jgi:hypothetical protein
MPILPLNPALIQAVKAARAAMAPERRILFNQAIDTAHHHAAAILAGRPPLQPSAFPELCLVKSMIGEAPPLNLPAPGIGATVDKYGVIWGFSQYENYDPGWANAWIEYEKYENNKAPFAGNAQCITIPNQVSLGIAGDWGTGYWRGASTPSAKVAQQMLKLSPDYTIHIGDTYYAGTQDEMTNNLASVWPQGTSGALAIPGNHEMYCGDWFYYAILPKLCPLQKGASYFALQNDNWLIVALDTSYYATNMYMDGSIMGPGNNDATQAVWLSQILQKANNRRVMIMTHHPPINLSGSQTNALYGQVMTFCRMANCKPAVWYFGHEHNAAVYSQYAQMYYPGRLIGHGAIPYGVASDLTSATGSSVVWAETQSANDSDYPERILNGFAAVNLNGSSLEETFYSENGDSRWSGSL